MSALPLPHYTPEGAPWQVGLRMGDLYNDEVPKEVVEEVSRILGGSGEVFLDSEECGVWQIDMPGPYDGVVTLEDGREVEVETPLP